MPDFYIKEILEYKSTIDLIENLYLEAIIKAYPIVLKTEGISEFDENHIRNIFQEIICFESSKLSEFINSRLVFLAVENQIVNKDNERKRTDIEFNIPKLRFVVECKKLQGVSRSQYINDGIRRFVHHEYIGGNEKYAGMCSFVVAGNMSNIIAGTKQRVEQFHCLKTSNEHICDHKNSFSTNHKKVDDNEILIYHLFFDMKQ